MGRYMDEITRSMDYLASHDDTVFLGQAVAVAGTAMRNTLLNVKEKKLIELPVEEEFQLGLSIGLSLNGRIASSQGGTFSSWQQIK
jgi:pyruvate/2-oxoglutarate/acetoin dehydrogenase E1 component